MNRRALAPALAVAALTAALGAATRPALADDGAALGRLFLTPQQRQLLDQRRADPAGKTNADLPADLLPARAAPPRRVVLNGVIRRGSEPPLVWINGRRADGSPDEGVRVRRGPDRQDRVTLEAGRTGAVVRLKPGQAWDPASGRVSDCLPCGLPARAESPPAVEAGPAAQAGAPDAAALASAAAPPKAGQAP